MDYSGIVDDAIQRLKTEGRYRSFAEIERIPGTASAMLRAPDGTTSTVAVWCSNDYLGMAANAAVIDAVTEASAYGAGSGGTRNISGTTVMHVALERELADWHRKEAGLLFSSGWVANFTSFAVLGSILPECVIYSDANNHNSMIEGMRRSGATVRVFRHNDAAHLEQLLRDEDPSRARVVAFESVYSMDGDIAPIAELADVAKRYLSGFRTEVVYRQDRFGRGGDHSDRFVGTKILNEAFLDRYNFTIEQEYPPRVTEERILKKYMESMNIQDENFADKLVRWADIIRKSFYEGAVDDVVSTRRLIDIVKGYSIFNNKEVAIKLALARFDTSVAEGFFNLYSKLDENITQEQPAINTNKEF